MGFSYTQQHFTPDELSPMRNMVSNFLKQAQQMQDLKYKPRMYEADILGKVTSPLAQFAASPAGNIWGGAAGDQARNAMSSAIQHYQQSQQQQPNLMQRLFGGGQQQFMQGGMQQPGMQGQPGQMNGGPMSDEQRQAAINAATQGATKDIVGPGEVSGTPEDRKIGANQQTRDQAQWYQQNKTNVNKSVSDLVSQIDNLTKNPDFMRSIQSTALGVQNLGVPYVSKVASAITPRSLENAENKVNDLFIKSGLYDKQTAYDLTHMKATQSPEDFKKELVKAVARLHTQGKVAVKGTAKGVSLSDKNPNNIAETETPKGASVAMMKNGILHFIPADKAEDAEKNWGYTRAQ